MISKFTWFVPFKKLFNGCNIVTFTKHIICRKSVQIPSLSFGLGLEMSDVENYS